MRVNFIYVICLGAVVLLWSGAAIWRASGQELMARIEQSYREYYLTQSGDSAGVPEPVRWDFERDTLVTIPKDEVELVEGSGGMQVMVIDATATHDGSPGMAIRLARIPSALFHGPFVIAMLVFAFLALRFRED